METIPINVTLRPDGYCLQDRMNNGGSVGGKGQIWCNRAVKQNGLCTKFRVGQWMQQQQHPHTWALALLYKGNASFILGRVGTTKTYNCLVLFPFNVCVGVGGGVWESEPPPHHHTHTYTHTTSPWIGEAPQPQLATHQRQRAAEKSQPSGGAVMAVILC